MNDRPIFLARESRDADALADRLRQVGIGVETQEVLVGQEGRGWQVSVPREQAVTARETAVEFENECYGYRQSQRKSDAPWGVIEDESHLRDPTSIYSAKSPMEAHFLRNLLAEQGIHAVVTNHTLHGGAGVDLVGTPTAAKVLVGAEDAEAARRFAVDFDIRTYEQTDTASHETDPGPETPWPQCPECDAMRTTRCPICHTSGTDFIEADRVFLGDLAEAGAGGESCGCGGGSCSSTRSTAVAEEEADLDGEDDPKTMLMCSVCDEPFAPKFPKQCEWCGHEFDEGYVIEHIVGPDEIPGRAIAVVAVLGIALIGTMAYFLWILG